MEQALGIATLVVVCVGFAVVIPLLLIVFLRRGNGNGETSRRVAADDARRTADDLRRAADDQRREDEYEREHDRDTKDAPRKNLKGPWAEREEKSP